MMKPKRYRSRVLRSVALSPSAFELTLERQGLPFQAGKEIQVHGTEPTEDRTYSIASGEQEQDLVLLYRLIPEGRLTPRLAKLQPGDGVEFTGPFGSFTLRDRNRPIVFIATGTGVAPCLSFIRTWPALQLTLLHGVRVAEDLFYRAEFERYAYHSCVSREDGAGFKGRVTDLLPTLAFAADAHYYLCGSNAMILDIHQQLKNRDVEEDRIFSEPYFFW
jgi:ferredoxin-NADP reductase